MVGAAKAGTTSLYYYLKSHPAVFGCPIKEPHYFGSDIRWKNFRKDYKRNTSFDVEKYLSANKLQFRHNGFVSLLNNYEALFREATNEKYLLDASASYLYSKKAAKEIHNFNPDAKIIIILREPVDRTLSHYFMDLSRSAQQENDILKGLKKDYYSSQKGWGISHLYIELSLYLDQIQRYIEVFPDDQLLILDYEELKDNRKLFLNKIFVFLELDKNKLKTVNLKRTFNKTLVPKNSFISKIEIVKNIIPPSLTTYIKRKASFLYKTKNDFQVPDEVLDFISDLVMKDWKKSRKLINNKSSE